MDSNIKRNQYRYKGKEKAHKLRENKPGSGKVTEIGQIVSRVVQELLNVFKVAVSARDYFCCTGALTIATEGAKTGSQQQECEWLRYL